MFGCDVRRGKECLGQHRKCLNKGASTQGPWYRAMPLCPYAPTPLRPYAPMPKTKPKTKPCCLVWLHRSQLSPLPA